MGIGLRVIPIQATEFTALQKPDANVGDIQRVGSVLRHVLQSLFHFFPVQLREGEQGFLLPLQALGLLGQGEPQLVLLGHIPQDDQAAGRPATPVSQRRDG